ncbi:DUF3748 domain-containing protein [Ruficoccus amylovorans]|uniref:DUF3748 domain-containing protein n=2 Tax=Ruficoccus amylovorans TaxID=1804625 RepID=A0A842H7Y4_9BACT|nr:DUF3748 domain-containing protein [Ruficoccus amylovorans]
MLTSTSALGLPAAASDQVPQIIDLSSKTIERQLTQGRGNHLLTNTSVWSPDSQWIVYDTPPDPTRFSGTRIEQVNVETGAVELLYESQHGANCGVATYHPTEPKVVFILGPEHPTPDWDYAFTRRRGVIVDVRAPKQIRPLDAMNYAPPYVAGALRGGSHVHVFSRDGQWGSFTYEDEILARQALAPDTGQSPNTPEPNQRNIGVFVPQGPVRVNRNHPRNHDGDYFSVVVSRTVAQPEAGSDAISRAFEESWIGQDGYIREDGSRQKRALAFQGMVTAADGQTFPEVFILDLPEDLTRAGDLPLEGSDTRWPAPPLGVSQRRLTFTTERLFPGIQGPRHWLRSSPDGSKIAFLMKDDDGIPQLWLVSPLGGAPKQLTHNPWSITSAFSWSPDGRFIAYVMDHSVFITEATSGHSFRLTARSPEAVAPQFHACVFSPDGQNIAFVRRLPYSTDEYYQICVLGVPPIPDQSL